MKIITKTLFLFASGFASIGFLFGQTAPQPPPALAPVRVVGKAKVFYLEKFNRTNAQIQFSIFGEIGDIYKKKDVVTLMVEYDAEGKKVRQPKTLKFRVTLYYGAESRFRDDHKLTIYLDNKRMLSDELVPRADFAGFPGNRSAYLELREFKYKDLLKMTKAQKIVFQIGPNKIELKPEAVKAFRDLNDTIEK